MSETQIKVIVGLGNPGDKYARNRHNIGFMAVEELARRLKVTFQASGAVYQWAAGPGFALVKPLTYMNLSGEALMAWADNQGLNLSGRPDEADETGPEVAGEMETTDAKVPEETIAPLIVCDDLALPMGSVRLRARGSSGGQNGLASVIEHLGGQEIPRMRLGIAPLGLPVDPAEWPDYVLSDFAADEAETVADLVNHAADALAHWLANDWETTTSSFNRRIRPPEA